MINDGGYIRQVPGPLLTYMLRSSWRAVIVFFHNFIIFFGVLAYVEFWPGWGLLEALVAFAFVTINGTWIAVVVGILSARYRDIPQIIQSVMSVVFFLTPVIWQSDHLRGRFAFIEYNPFYHFLEVVRGPLIGGPIDPWSWWVTGGMAVFGSIFALVFLGRYRRRIPYWI